MFDDYDRYVFISCDSAKIPKEAYAERVAFLRDGKGDVEVRLKGRVLNPKEMRPKTQLIELIISILNEKENSWGKLDINTYASNLQIDSDDIRLNILNDGIILNIRINDDRWRQYSTNIEPKDFKFYLENAVE